MHNEGLCRRGGEPATVRIDNLKMGVTLGAGAWGVLNPSDQRYARAVGI